MPAVDTVLLPLCVGLTLLGVIITGLAWRRGNRGRVVQAAALALAPVALYFSGLLSLLWDAVAALVTWVGHVILRPSVWFGLGLLALCLVLWVVGGLVARRPGEAKRVTARKDRPAAGSGRRPAAPATSRGKTPAGSTGKTAVPVDDDDDMAEIEALLKARGIK